MMDLSGIHLADVAAAAGVIVCVFLLFNLYVSVRQWRRLPPGPWGLPLVGYIPFLGGHPYLKLMELQKIYGNIFSLQMGSVLTVCIGDMQLFRMAMVNQGETFAGRPDSFVLAHLGILHSLSLSNYSKKWKKQRKAANGALRMFAGSRRSPADLVVRESKRLVASFLRDSAASPEKKFDPSNSVFLAVGSIIYQLCRGKQKDITKCPEFCKMVLDARKSVEVLSASSIVEYFPWTRFLLWEKFRRFATYSQNNVTQWTKVIDEHLRSFNPSKLGDVTDALIAASVASGEKNRRLSKEELVGSLTDIFIGGFETISITLTWQLMYMVLHLDVQNRVQAEIDANLGSEDVSLSDKCRLPFAEAVVLETLRFSTILPLGIPHRTLKDCQLGGYFIPKDATIWTNLWAICRDEDVWKDPEIFRPERFLTTSGEIDAVARENMAPFGGGRRRCLGEFLAKDELFLFFVTIMQHCSLRKPDDAQYSMRGRFAFTLAPYPFEIIAVKRQQKSKRSLTRNTNCTLIYTPYKRYC